ncbi:hypothetical protein [Chitinophaga rhizosphaerae]|uniref:hypothetical protein n=1 Tax=Chitinophaga rhizosphaerae TaxID=1864947 RepID=UPI000F80CB49|nr:hypothetical protein [Chitinophaga rhizosphaerae]
MYEKCNLVEIPILPHVKSFVTGMFGPEPIPVHEKHILGRELENFIIQRRRLTPDKIRGNTLQLRLSQRIAPFYIKFKEALSLGCFFEKTFHSCLYFYVSAQEELGVSQNVAIRSFLQRFNIDEETYDTSAARMVLIRMKKHQKKRGLTAVFFNA